MISTLCASLALFLVPQGAGPDGPSGPGAGPERKPGEPEQAEPSAPRPIYSEQLEMARAKSLNNWYDESDHWALKGIVITSYGQLWHAVGAEALVDALGSKQPELNAFALEALLATDTNHLPNVLTPELLTVLTKKGLSYKHDFMHGKVVAVLERGLPQVSADEPADFKRWWRDNKRTYVTPKWILPEPPDGLPEAASASFLKRALDLNAAGMELAIVIDTTGSMQTTIDASAIALTEITEIMEGITPNLKVGLTEYKDYLEFGQGGQILVKMTTKISKVRKRLGSLVAGGGGDFPEAAYGALKVALGEKMDWERAANKVVILISDAPCHPKNQAAMIELARSANESPFGVDASDIIDVNETGSRSKSKRGVRPFIISAIGVGPNGVAQPTRDSLRPLSEAGGGAYAEVHTENAGSSKSVATKIVKHVLTLAFGSRWKSQMDVFMTIYMEYREQGCLGQK
ncbi:MAG: hypothetical protein ACI9D0_000051 [Bacteroidia bacterium]|jgi:hypothetical protein